MTAPIKYPVRFLDHRISENFYEPRGRKKMAETFRYLAKFAKNDTAFMWLNLRADEWEGLNGKA